MLNGKAVALVCAILVATRAGQAPPTQCGDGQHGATCDDGDGEYAEEDRECLRALLRDITATQHSHCRRVATSAVPPWGFASECMGARERACVRGRERA